MTTDYMPSHYQNNRERYQCGKLMEGLRIQKNFECACSSISEHYQKLNIDPKLECIVIDLDFVFRFQLIQLCTHKDGLGLSLFST